ncbi:MAG: hypothetical protein M1363_06525 [Gammaproteobacteria bacterium]|nr:hypothetical protein [Gammaproteobacteria bacterium]
MKLCVIGNSHAGCVRKAIETYAPQLDFSPTFFASSGSTVVDSRMKDQTLQPQTELLRASWEVTSGGLEEIHFPDYDAIWLLGFPAAFHELASIARQLVAPFSVQFRQTAVVKSRPAMQHLVPMLQGLSCPIFVTSRPNRAVVPKRSSNDCGEAEYDASRAVVANLFADFGMTYVPQPLETLSSMGTTKLNYSKAGLGLGKSIKEGKLESQKGEDDVTHMNVEYGLAILKTLQALISSPKDSHL